MFIVATLAAIIASQARPRCQPALHPQMLVWAAACQLHLLQVALMHAKLEHAQHQALGSATFNTQTSPPHHALPARLLTRSCRALTDEPVQALISAVFQVNGPRCLHSVPMHTA